MKFPPFIRRSEFLDASKSNGCFGFHIFVNGILAAGCQIFREVPAMSNPGKPAQTMTRKIVSWGIVIALLAGLFLFFQLGIPKNPLLRAVISALLIVLGVTGYVRNRIKNARDPAYAQKVSEAQARGKAETRMWAVRRFRSLFFIGTVAFAVLAVNDLALHQWNVSGYPLRTQIFFLGVGVCVALVIIEAARGFVRKRAA
jgi:hypothetical protein